MAFPQTMAVYSESEPYSNFYKEGFSILRWRQETQLACTSGAYMRLGYAMLAYVGTTWQMRFCKLSRILLLLPGSTATCAPVGLQLEPLPPQPPSPSRTPCYHLRAATTCLKTSLHLLAARAHAWKTLSRALYQNPQLKSLL